MNMISTGSFLTEMDATEKQQTIAEKFARVWEVKNAKAARAGGVSLMALSLAACGSSSTTTDSSGGTSGTSGTATNTVGNFNILRNINNEPDEITIASGGATAGDDTISGTFNNSGANDTGTINPGDFINLGAGADEAQIRAGDEMTAVLMPVLSGVETVSITNTAAVGAHTGLDVWAPDATSIVVNGSNATTLNDLAYATQSVTMNGTSGNLVLDGTGTTASITVAGTTAGDIDVSTATTATLTVTAASTIDDIANGDLTTLNIAGSGAFTLGAVTEGLTTISGANNTGGLDLTGVDATATSVTGSSADDVIGTTGILDNDGDSTAINGGEGTDTLVIDANITDASAVTNVETLELAVDNLTYDMDTITGLTSIVVATDGAVGAANADSAVIDDYDAGTIVISDKNQADVDDNDTITVAINIAEDFGEGDADSITVAIEATQAVGADEEDFVVADIDINDEATGGENIETFNINVTGERGVTISALNIDDQGDTPVVNINSAVDLSITGVAFETTVNDDDNGNTISFAGSAGDVTYTIGDAGYSMDADDVITGGDGADTLSIDVEADDHAATISGFETISITDSNGGSIDFETVSGYTTIGLAAASDTGNLTLSNVATGVTLAVTDESTGNTINVDGAAAGSSVTVTFADADEYDGTETLDFGAEFTTINFVVDEDDADVDTITATIDAASAVTITVSGDDSTDGTFTLATDFAATANAITIDADIDMTHDMSADTVDDDVTLSYAGSAGAVSLTLLDNQLGNRDTTIIGGDGDSDTLTVDIDDVDSAATVSGFETLALTDTDGATLDMDDFSGVTTVTITSTAGGLTINNADGSESFEITDGGDNDLVFDGSSTTGEGLSVSITGVDDLATTDIHVTDIETVTFTAGATQAGTVFDLSDAEVDTLVLVAEADATDITGGGTIAGVNTLDLSGANGDVDLSGVTVGATVAVTLGAINNDITLTFVAGSSQTVTAADTLAGTVYIDGFTAAGATGDKIDLSALGITGLADLSFSDANTDGDGDTDDVSITAADSQFAGTIVLEDITTAMLTAANFDFA